MSDLMNRITVTCDTKDALPFEKLEVFQGSLKKRSPEDYRKIRESILRHGFAAPFFVWRDGERNRLLDGTGRYETLEAMRQEGYELPELPVVYVTAGSDADARELLLKITSQYGKVSSKGLEEFLKGLEIDLDGLALNVFIKRDLPEVLGIVPPAPREPIKRQGDVYELRDEEGGIRHKLACADARSETDFSLLMGGEQAALVVTDPPYGVNYGEKIGDLENGAHKANARREGGNIENDGLPPAQLRALLAGAFKNVYRHMREDASFYVCGGSFPVLIQAQLTALEEAGLTPKHMLVWCKNQAVFSMNRTDYDYQHELIWYGWKEKHLFYGQGKYRTTLWNFKKPQKSDLHPTMKPPELIEEAIKNSMEPVDRSANGILNHTGKNAIVLDPFAGSGSVLAACEHLKRRAFMIEISPRYCDVIIRRALDINSGLAVWRIRDGRGERLERGLFVEAEA